MEMFIQETASGVPCSSSQLREVSHEEHIRRCQQSTQLVKDMRELEADHRRRWDGAVKIEHTNGQREFNGNAFYWVDKNGKRLTY